MKVKKIKISTVMALDVREDISKCIYNMYKCYIYIYYIQNCVLLRGR